MMPTERAWHATGALINIPAMAVIAGITASARRRRPGIRRAPTTSSSRIKLVIIVVFIVAAAPFVSAAHWVTASNPGGHFHSAQYRSRPIRLQRRHPRRRGGVLRLYRLRCGLDRGAGGEESASATCRSAFSDRCSFAPCSMSLVGFVLTGIVPYDKLNVPDPIAVGIDAVGLSVAFADPQSSGSSSA